MPVSVSMPSVGEGAHKVTIGLWLRRVGEPVAEGEPLLEVVSDKVTVEVPAPVSGTLAAIMATDGQDVAVGETIATIALAGEAVNQPAPVVAPTPAPPSPLLTPPTHVPVVPAPAAPPPANGPIGVVAAERRLLSPAVLTLATAYGLDSNDLASWPGSGLGGRLTRADVVARVTGMPAMQRATLAVATPVATAEARLEPLTPMRRAIAEHMERSVRTAPHGWLSVEIDMSAVQKARTRDRAVFESAYGVPLTYVAYFALAAIAAARAVPAANATWEDDRLMQQSDVNLAVAVAVDGGLLVPVIAGADGLNLTGMARALDDRIQRARVGRLTRDELSGGTLTINNTGAVGSVLSRPIINQPQVAIVTMEAIVPRPVVVGEDGIAIRPMMNACLSYDERALDAAGAAAFLGAIRQCLQAWAD